jgi:hypothetical protein
VQYAGAPFEKAALGYWLASQMAHRVNSAPSHAHMALQTLAVIAAARRDRIGDAAAACFHRVTGREVVRPFPVAPYRGNEPPADA